MRLPAAFMQFRIADTFTDSLARLTSDEQKAVKTAAFDLQMNPAQPSLQLHRVDKSKDRNFWSARVSLDLRLIVHRTESSFLLCYVQHHDEAYEWARRRKLETHPNTGAAQLVELRETVQEVVISRPILRGCAGIAGVPSSGHAFKGISQEPRRAPHLLLTMGGTSRQGKPEATGTDGRAVLRTRSTCERWGTAGFHKEPPRNPLEGRGEQADVSAEGNIGADEERNRLNYKNRQTN